MISAVGCQNIGKLFIAIVDYNFGNSITDKCNDIYQMSGISYIYRIRESTSLLDKIFVIWYINSMHIRYRQDTDNHRYSWYLFWINIILETKISCLDFAKIGAFHLPDMQNSRYALKSGWPADRIWFSSWPAENIIYQLAVLENYSWQNVHISGWLAADFSPAGRFKEKYAAGSFR